MESPSTALPMDSSNHRLASLRFDRRRSPRNAAAGHVTLLRQSPKHTGYQFPVCAIHLTDMSDHGLGARCDIPLDRNEPVAVFLPPHGNERGIDIVGHITHVEQADPDGYHIGIQFDPRPAA